MSLEVILSDVQRYPDSIYRSLVIDHVKAEFQEQGVAIAFAFCRYNDPDANTGVRLIASLAKQLAVRNGEIHPKLSHLYDKLTKDKKMILPNVKELRSLVLSLTSTYERAYILVDSLDECEKKDRAVLLSVLKDISNLNECRVCVMATSRPHALDVNIAFKSSACLEIKARESDIREYVRFQLQNNADYLELITASERRDLEETIISSVASRASGSYV